MSSVGQIWWQARAKFMQHQHLAKWVAGKQVWNPFNLFGDIFITKTSFLLYNLLCFVWIDNANKLNQPLSVPFLFRIWCLGWCLVRLNSTTGNNWMTNISLDSHVSRFSCIGEMCDPVPLPAIYYWPVAISQQLQLDIKDTDIASSFSRRLEKWKR